MGKAAVASVACIFCAARLWAATYYLDARTGSDTMGAGSVAAPWASIARAFAAVKPGDTVLLRPGNYGPVEFKEGQGLGSAEGGPVTYAADPATTTPRPDTWYEEELPRPDPANPDGKVIFTGIRFGLFSRDKDAKTKTGTPAGHYVTIEGLDVVGGNITLVSFVSHVTVRRCNVFGTWGEFSTKVTGSGINLYRAYYWGSDYRHILVEDCYATRCGGGAMLLGNFRDVTVRGCHFHHFAGTGISLQGTMDRVLLEGNHVHHQVPLADTLKHRVTVAAPDAKEPNRVFTISGDISFYDWAVVTDAATGKEDLREVEGYDRAARRLTLKAPLSFAARAGDAVTLWDGNHGSGLSVRVSNFTFRGNRVHDCGTTRGIYFYTPGDEGYHDVVIENNLFYSILNQYAVDLNKGMGNNCVVRNNTIAGRKHANYDGNRNSTMLYGLALVGAVAAPKADPKTMVVANNVIVGLGSAPAAAVVRNNIVYAGGGFEEDKEGPNAGNLVYCKGEPVGTEAHPFDGSGKFFVGGGRFDELAFKARHAENFNNAFRLVKDARAVGFADPAHAPAIDITGAARDAAPDAGCYEFGAQPSRRTQGGGAGK